MIDKIKKHTDSWQRDLDVQSKYVIMVLWPDKAQYANIDECRSSLKKAIALQEDCISKSTLYFLPNGFEQLKTVQQKKFSKDIHGLLVSYYRQKKENVKIKQKKLIAGQIQHFRYTMKETLYSMLTSNDYTKCINRIKPAYSQLKAAGTVG
jgi:RecG-like helicase